MLKKLTKTSNAYNVDLTRVQGDLSSVWGNLTGVSGDLDECGITEADRKTGVNIEYLISEE